MNTLKAEKRSMDIKAKKLRREGYVVGNVFGKKIEGSIPVKFQKLELEKFLKKAHKGSQIMLDVEGTQYDALIKDVAYNPVAGRIDEIDFQALVSTEKVHSVVEVILENHDKIVEGVLQESLEEIAYKADGIHYYVRKAAHMTEYFLLAIAISFPLYVYGVRGIWLMLLAGIVCVGFAGLDEYHQSFVDARTPAVKDVGIDSIGVFAGIIMMQFICFLGRVTLFRPLARKRKEN